MISGLVKRKIARCYIYICKVKLRDIQVRKTHLGMEYSIGNTYIPTYSCGGRSPRKGGKTIRTNKQTNKYTNLL